LTTITILGEHFKPECYQLPNVPEDYVHRIGRTGRAGSKGEAISLVSADEAKQLFDIERLTQKYKNIVKNLISLNSITYIQL
jgi:superfamily II DNA/RNA helicase